MLYCSYGIYFVNQQDQRSELQERIAAELREKAKASSLQEKATMDGVDDIRYLEGTETDDDFGVGVDFNCYYGWCGDCNVFNARTIKWLT